MKTLGQIASVVMEQMKSAATWEDLSDPREIAHRWECAAQAVAEECAKVCAAQWQIDGQFTADEFAAEIRAMAEVKK